MHKHSPTPDILQNGGFSLHYYVGRLLKIDFFGQCLVLAALAAIGMLAASAIDHSLILEGRDVGLLQHPALWGFPLLQIVLPLCIRQSLQKLQSARLRNGEITKAERRRAILNGRQIQRFLAWKDRESQFAATVIYCAGLIAFIWNTYQNQRPGIVVPFDFWDSKTYLWGFWFTRVYKLYLFVWLFPYIAMIYAAILIVTLRFIRRARTDGKLMLLPFHPDGVGGLGFVTSLISTPIVVTLIVGSLATAVAFLVHRAADVMPLIGLIVLVTWATIAYFLPVLFLRSDIVAMKRAMLEKLRALQQANYSRIIDSHGMDVEMLSKGKEALDYFDNVCMKVQALSNYPHLKRVVSALGFAATTSTFSMALKLFDVAPKINGLLKPLMTRFN